MSYDRAIEQVCPHGVVEEPLFLSSDRQTVRPLRPIASSRSVRVRVNGEAEANPTGLFTAATASGSISGPFQIQGGVNDTLVVKINGGSEQTLSAPSGNRVSSQQVIDVLNTQIRDAYFVIAPHQRLRLLTARDGESSTIFVKTTGSTLAATVGLYTNRFWRGKTIIPAWTLVNDPNTLSDRPTRLVIFDEPLQGYRDYVELDYITIREECRRCGGLGVENDWRYDSSGEIVTLVNEDLLLQEFTKALWTVQGSNVFHTWYGTRITESVGRKQTGLIQNLIVSDIHESFRRWQSIKRQQEENVGQIVTDEEYPFRLLSVTLEQSDEDPTVIMINSVVQNRSQKPIQLSRGIRAPLPVDLLGSTQQRELVQASLPNYQLVS
jgi:hypothetical protein